MATFSRFNVRAAKLTPSQVFNIRQKYALGRSQASLAREYDMSVGQIGRICRNESWQQFAKVPTKQDKQMEEYIERVIKEPPTPEEEARADASFRLIEELLKKGAKDGK